MSGYWQLRLAQPEDSDALATFLHASELEAVVAVENTRNEQLLLAIPISADGKPGTAMGCIRIRRNIGQDLPRYWYHLGCVVHAAPELGLFHKQRTLLLGNDHTGATELDCIAVNRAQLDAAQSSMLTTLLVRGAMLLLRQESAGQKNTSAPSKIIVSVPGVVDERGQSPFWQGLGRHFYPGDVASAQAKFGELWLVHVAALLPRHPLIASLLTTQAQQAIAGVQPDATNLCRVLTELGLREGEHVNVYDAGPVFEGSLELLAGAPSGFRRKWTAQAKLPTTHRYLLAQSNSEIWLVPAHLGEQEAIMLGADYAGLLRLRASDLVWAEEFSQ
jgi:arginine N-succinyltransferase